MAAGTRSWLSPHSGPVRDTRMLHLASAVLRGVAIHALRWRAYRARARAGQRGRLGRAALICTQIGTALGEPGALLVWLRGPVPRSDTPS